MFERKFQNIPKKFFRMLLFSLFSCEINPCMLKFLQNVPQRSIRARLKIAWVQFAAPPVHLCIRLVANLPNQNKLMIQSTKPSPENQKQEFSFIPDYRCISSRPSARAPLSSSQFPFSPFSRPSPLLLVSASRTPLFSS